MSQKSRLRFDEIGYWSEIKLEIIREYAAAYSRILTAQTRPRLSHIYIDAFAGAGVHLSRQRGDFVQGSPLNALQVQPPFREYHLIDLDRKKVDSLRWLIGTRADVHIHEGDCNAVLVNEVFPKVQFKDFRRGSCLLDPYGLHLNWEVIEIAGGMKSIDMFLNFPVADMNRNVLWRDPRGVDPADVSRMTAFWGDESWRSTAYSTQQNLFAFEEKVENAKVAESFRERLMKLAGFRYVPSPLPMRNSKGAIVYYFFFASQKIVARGIVDDIFAKYAKRGMK